MSHKMRELKIEKRLTNRTENIDRYFNDINKIPRLSVSEEVEIAFKAREGDVLARSQLINSNLKFVVSVAKQYSNRYVVFSDLISEGNLGLVEAAETFDPTTGFKFISYAVWHIRKNIYKYLNDFTRVVRLPANVIRDLNRAKKVEARLSQENEREISVEEILTILDELDMPVNKHILLQAMEVEKSISFDKPVSDEEDSPTPANYIATDHTYANPSVRVDAKDQEIIFEHIFSVLTPIERSIIIRRLGLDDGITTSFKEIAKYYDKTPEWARLVFMKALRKAKSRAISSGWKSVEWQKRTNFEAKFRWPGV